MEFRESGRSKSSVVVENRIDFLLEVGVGVGGTMGDVRVALLVTFLRYRSIPPII